MRYSKPGLPNIGKYTNHRGRTGFGSLVESTQRPSYNTHVQNLNSGYTTHRNQSGICKQFLIRRSFGGSRTLLADHPVHQWTVGSSYADISSKMAPLSNLDLVKAVDIFPYDQEGLAKAFSEPLYTLLHRTSSDKDVIIGYMHPPVVQSLFSIPETIRGPLEIDPDSRTIRAFDLPTEAERTKVVTDVMQYWRANGPWEIVKKWRNEPWPVYSSDGGELLYSVERAGAGLLGVMRYGVHMTGYVKDAGAKHGIKIWVPKRASNKSNYPGMLDNTVAGGLMTAEDPFECIIREADEEADLPEALMRERCKVAGTVVYLYVTDERAGGERDLIYPETQWVYDIELPADIKPTPKDGEAEAFYLWTVEEVQEAMARGEFKPNCALVLLDFFIRRGILTKENEPDFDELVRGMHRKTPFPGPHQTGAPSFSLR
ncbi:NUDIX domain-containing protein [Seiridium cupressi]